MTDWSERSLAALAGVNPQLIDIMGEVRRRSGIPFEVTEGLRNQERQRDLLEAGKSKTMNSKHLTGNAMDIFIPTSGGGANWDFEAYRPLGDMFKTVAQERGVDNAVWGGDWKTLRDGVNFQLNGSDYRAPNTPNLSMPTSVPKMDTGVAGMFQAPPDAFNLGTALGGRPTAPQVAQPRQADAERRAALADLIRY